MIPLNKVCSICKINKSINNFGNDKKSKDNKNACCKQCRSKQTKIYREKYKDKIKIEQANIYKKNRIQRLIYAKNRNKQISQSIKEYRKLYYEKNRKLLINKSKLYYDNNKDLISAKAKVYREKNVKKISSRHMNRYRFEPIYRFKHCCRNRINKAIKGFGQKSKKTLDLLGVKEWKNFIEHIENQFYKDNRINWSNYGEWHIDHIIPCASFDLSNEEEQKKCFHYTNLQPMWGIDNIKKGKKIINEN